MVTAALVAVTALLIAVPVAVAEAAPSSSGGISPDGPVSGKLVPALRGEAATAAAGPQLAERYRELSESRDAKRPAGNALDITPWVGAIHNGWGAFPNVISNGAQANHTVNPNIHLSPGNPDFVYAPTLDPSGITCIEVTTFYWQGGNGVGAWDWCAASPGWAAIAWIDASFMSTYTTPVFGVPAYTVRDVQTDPVTNSWTAYLFNHTTQSWDALHTSADPAKLSVQHGGWSMFEVYTNYNPATGEGYYCTETYGSQFWASGIQIRVGSTWQTLTTANSNVPAPGGLNSTDFGCYSLSFTLQTANSSWQVTH